MATECRLETLTFTDEKGTTGRAWDRAVRTTKQSETSTDAVAILAVLTQKQPQAGGASEETVVLVKQFRPPINAYTIELPAVSVCLYVFRSLQHAKLYTQRSKDSPCSHRLQFAQGLIDEGETPAQAALRELKEECGYIGEVTSVSPYLAMSPGMTNESIMLVTVDVDLSLPANQEPQQNLDEGEFCEVLKVPTASLIKELLEFDKQGVKVFCGLWCLAHGMSVRMGAHASK